MSAVIGFYATPNRIQSSGVPGGGMVARYHLHEWIFVLATYEAMILFLYFENG